MSTEQSLTDLPIGADHATEWEADAGRMCRAVYGPAYPVRARALNADGITVRACATQYDDGSVLNSRREVANDRPIVMIDYYDDDGGLCELTTIGVDEALELAAALLSAVCDVDGWATR